MRFAHVCLVARDADGLAEFYIRVFGCVDRRPRRTLSGDAVGRGIGLPDAEIRAIWLTLPGRDGPFLEIHQYRGAPDRPPPRVDEPGFGHIAFAVADIRAAMAAIVAAGGSAQGELTDLGRAGAPVLAVYMRDPEGNMLELEQSAGA